MFEFVLLWWSGIVKLHEDIAGRWHNYLWNVFALKSYLRANPKGRVDLHDVWSDDPQDGGIIPFPEETKYARPKLNKGEDLFIYGSNTGERTTIEVNFKRRPLPRPAGRFDPPQDRVEVKFRLDDGKGNVYWMEEEEVRHFLPNEYRAAGFAFESLQDNRTGRIKFRGYLRKNQEDKLYYVQIRFLCLFYSKTVDHLRNFDKSFLAKELCNESLPGAVEDLLEDKIEQLCHIKGTFKLESNDETELHFLASLGRSFLPKRERATRRVFQISGITEHGVGFEIGLVSAGKFRYRYGFVAKNCNPVRMLESITLSKDELQSNLSTEGKCFGFEAKFAEDDQVYKFEIGKYRDHRRMIRVDGVAGMAFVTELELSETLKVVNRKTDKSLQAELDQTLVVALDQDSAQVVELTGGKGASLAQLKHLSKSTDWTVPNALVVTTSAFQVQTEGVAQFENKLRFLERQVLDRTDVEKECAKMVNWFASQQLNAKIKKKIEAKIAREFGDGWQEKQFAVRSSAANEDSSEMSAAGQMTTYLGVRGLENLFSAVMKCWASQYAFVPIEYKRGYGQELSSPMAVVVQEMVDCDSAGVIFTANPTDGDERLLTVTANFGLGESVVSASADPDTFQLAINIKANSYEIERTVSAIESKTLGKKSLVTRLNQDVKDIDDLESFVLNEETENGAQQQSLEDADVLRVGQIALKIQQHYGNPRDIEWGIKNGKFCMFQSRPITNLDSTFSNYELMHEMDTPHSTEHELYSRAHWGENYPGSASWLAAFFFLSGTMFPRSAVQQGQMKAKDFNPFQPIMGYVCNQLMFNFNSSPFMMMFKDYPDSDASVANVFAFFGRHVTDPDFRRIVSEKSAFMDKNAKWIHKIIMPFIMFYMLFFGCKDIPKFEKKIFEENVTDFVTQLKPVSLKDKTRKLFVEMAKHMPMLQVHGSAAFGSALKSQFLLKLLKSGGDTAHIDEDVNLMLGHCNDVVSAEVPNILREIANAVRDKKAFAELSDEEALEVLRSPSKEPEAAQVFTQFLKKHGHRGYREFDFLYLPWGRNPIPCVQVVKSMLKGGANLKPKREVPIDEILDQLKTPLSWTKKQLIKYWFLPWVRDAVGFREHTKSLMIKFHDSIRDAFRHMADEMVAEGFLPEQDLFFYLKFHEIYQLSNGSRDPLLVMKAKQRKRLYPKMNALKFDEFVRGFRMNPRPVKKEKIELSADAVCLKGTAVTVGDIKARVCVAETIDEAVNIQQGDILLTYSTDIGWSPYFPLISGIVTEIGGTISHGAVIAREFGIPCLIAVEDACSYFKTGDTAYLDTKTGSIVKVKQ